MSNEGPVYELVNGPNACDICISLAGIYPAAPHVPIHFMCNCTVEMIDPEDPDGTTYEVRNVEWDTEKWTEEVPGVLSNCGAEAKDVSFDLENYADVTPFEHFDPGVQAAAEEAGWQMPEAQGIATSKVPMAANTETEFTIAVRYVSVLFKGELWRVHTAEDEAAGTRVEEQLIDEVGGLYEAAIGIEVIDQSTRPCTDNTDNDYFQDGDESPWLDQDPREIEA